MSEAGAVLESLYTHLILRDLFGKVAPGTVILLAIRGVLTSPAQVLTDMNAANLGAWIVFGSLAWLAGLAIQGLGEITSLIPYFPVRYFPIGVTEATYRKKLVAFDADGVATLEDKQRFERLVVIREASGNGFMAVLMALLLVIVVRRSQLLQFLPGLIVTVVALVGLMKLHYANAKRSVDHIEQVVARRQQ